MAAVFQNAILIEIENILRPFGYVVLQEQDMLLWPFYDCICPYQLSNKCSKETI